MHGPFDAERARLAALLAEDVMDETTVTPRGQRRTRDTLRRVLDYPHAFRAVVALCDEALRASPGRPFRQALMAVRRHDLAGLATFDRVGLTLLSVLAAVAPRPAQRVAVAYVRRLTAPLIGRAEPRVLRRHIVRRTKKGFVVNVNLLGEAVLGHDEANTRYAGLVALMARPDVTYVSLKLSAVLAQMQPWDVDGTVERACERLRDCAQIARTHDVFVNVDMEEYRDLEVTLRALEGVALEPACRDTAMGVVLQAYLPDAHAAFERVHTLAKSRASLHGAPLKVRIVKGANLAMEHVEAEMHGWTPAPYGTKAEVDASWVALVARALEVAGPHLRVGVATHNTYDAAWAMTLATDLGVQDHVDLEMLEGMADAQAAAWVARGCRVVLYTPVTPRRDFTAAISYLIRRLDENTAPDNFLRSSFRLQKWSVRDAERTRFFRSLDDAPSVLTHRRRVSVLVPEGDFLNEPDADPTDREMRGSILTALTSVPATPSSEKVTRDMVTELFTTLAQRPVWSWSERRRALWAFADIARAERANTTAMMANETKKTVTEANGEISEACDFARLYSLHIHDDLTPLGVVTVTPPWNFPYAIPAGGVMAALAAGNAVILKPAPEARAVGTVLAEQLWRAGVPRSWLHLVLADDDEAGAALVTNADAVILTGSRAAAELFFQWRPDIRVLAETNGKNAMVISGRADIDLAVKDLVQSAFSNSGQKCSAASLAIVTKEVANDERFWRQLRDAVRSLAVGEATASGTAVGPLISEPSDNLARALLLERHEKWLLKPERLPSTNVLYSPGIKVNVQPGSWTHLTEWFGPVLGVMVAPDLATATAWQNATAYGLTAGLHSLDEGEIRQWVDTVAAGNLYINRPTTGAIVGRQPFGGWRASAMGPTTQVGTPDYIRCLGHVPTCHDRAATIVELAAWWEQVGARALRSGPGLVAEANWHRYRPYASVVVRVENPDADTVTFLEEIASICHVSLSWSSSAIFAAHRPVVVETGRELALRLGPDDLIRWLSDRECPMSTCAARGIRVDTRPIAARGDDEGPRWLRPQTVSMTRHRWGNPHAGPRLELA